MWGVLCTPRPPTSPRPPPWGGELITGAKGADTGCGGCGWVETTAQHSQRNRGGCGIYKPEYHARNRELSTRSTVRDTHSSSCKDEFDGNLRSRSCWMECTLIFVIYECVETRYASSPYCERVTAAVPPCTTDEGG